MSIPNFLSLIRILLVPITVIFLISGSFVTALAVFSLASITDALDGFLARVLNQKTTLGAYLDPIADKALLDSCYVTLAVLHLIPSWLAVIVVSRDFIILFGISILFMASVPLEIRPFTVGKVTTGIQLITVLFTLILLAFTGGDHPFVMGVLIPLLYWTTGLFTVVSGFHYIVRGIKAINQS